MSFHIFAWDSWKRKMSNDPMNLMYFQAKWQQPCIFNWRRIVNTWSSKHLSVSGAVLGIPWNSTTVNLQPTNINYRILSTTYTFDTVCSVSVADNHFGIWALFLSLSMILNRRMATDLVFYLISSNLFSFTIWYFQFCSWYLGEVHLLCIVSTNVGKYSMMQCNGEKNCNLFLYK